MNFTQNKVTHHPKENDKCLRYAYTSTVYYFLDQEKEYSNKKAFMKIKDMVKKKLRHNVPKVY